MTILLAIAGGVLLVALVHLIAGWVVSRELYRGALAVQSRSIDGGVRIRRVGNGRIDLEAPTPRQDIGHPGTIGLRWEGGYGRVGHVIEVNNNQITREYTKVEGTPPTCVGPLTDCPPVELDPYAYPRDPSDVGLAFSEETYQTGLGPMGAWLVPGGTGERWAIHCHGWRAEKREHLRMLPAFHRQGFTSMVVNYRNDPDMPQDPTGRYRFGLSEWEDLEAAVRSALERGARTLVLFGASTGAALITAFLEQSPLADRVSALVFDAPNIILTETVRLSARESRLTPLMIEFGMWIADLRWKIDWDATNYVQRAADYLHVPALVFHGTSDLTVPISVSRQLEAKVPGLVELVETQAAGHVMSWNADPEGYNAHLSRFLGQSQNWTAAAAQ